MFGTRPEAIKLAPVIRELRNRATAYHAALAGDAAPITVKVCVTAQHREMLDQVLGLFDITPNYNLDVMHANQTPTQVAAAVLSRLEPILAAERPASVIADWHFAPTERARQNFLREDVPRHQVLVTGNPVIDAPQWVAALPPTHHVNDLLQSVETDGRAGACNTTPNVGQHAPTAHPSPVLLLVTAHLCENFGAPRVRSPCL